MTKREVALRRREEEEEKEEEEEGKVEALDAVSIVLCQRQVSRGIWGEGRIDFVKGSLLM